MAVMRIKDKTGEVVSGAYRTDAGAIVMHDPIGYGKYLKEKERAMEVSRLNQKVTDLEKLLLDVLSKIQST